ncbi:hypothetical protein Droror1_Dr00005281 [Drosera rotundifolia]
MNPPEGGVSRPLVHFPADIWGDFFINLKRIKMEDYAKEINLLKQETRAKLVMKMDDNSLGIDKLKLIDTLERLGVSYHYEEEIEELLQHIFYTYAKDDFCLVKDDQVDLYTTALQFRVFRQHGFKMPCDVFFKFLDNDGKFKQTLVSDLKGIISLYEAAHVRIRGERILDEALIFTTQHLKHLTAAANNPDLDRDNSNLHQPRLMKQVELALEYPMHYIIPRLEARRFISIYDEDETKDEALLRFAKVDFNMLQLQHQQELSYLCKWWKDTGLANKLPYIRDRSVEVYFWAAALYFEPQYSRGRVLVTKAVPLASMLDDTYDAYATFEELQRLTDAFERWEMNDEDQLSDYLKVVFNSVRTLFDEFDKEMDPERWPHTACYARETVMELIRSYFQEAKWLNAGYVPTFEEYLGNARKSSVLNLITTISFIGMEGVADEMAFIWLQSFPKIQRSMDSIGRLLDDIRSHEGLSAT